MLFQEYRIVLRSTLLIETTPNLAFFFLNHKNINELARKATNSQARKWKRETQNSKANNSTRFLPWTRMPSMAMASPLEAALLTTTLRQLQGKSTEPWLWEGKGWKNHHWKFGNTSRALAVLSWICNSKVV